MTAPTRTRTAAAAAALALCSAALLGACGSSGGSEPKEEPKATTTTTKVVAFETTTTSSGAGTSTTEAQPGGETTTTTLDEEGVDTETSQLDTLPDGVHHGYMAGLEKGKVEGQDVQVILWDEVELLTGQAAIDAARDDGVTLDTDYYVRNQNQTIRRLAVVPEASVTTLQEGSSGSRPSSVDEVWQQEHLFKIDVGNVRDITTVSSIDAVYLP